MKEKIKELLNFKEKYHISNYKFSLVALVTVLSVIGVLVVGSAAPALQGKQIMGVILGIVVMVVLSLIDYKFILKFVWALYILNIILLVAVHFFGVESHGAVRWLDLGIFQFQPSDLTKIILILFFAKFFTDRKEEITTKRTIIEAVLLIVPSLVLILKQPNLSNTICISLLFCIMFYLAGLSYKFIGRFLLIVIPVLTILFVIAIQPNQKLFHGYQQNRILAWIHPEDYATEEAYQQNNSVMAIGSGQLTGKGYNNNTTTSVKNGNFLSEPQTDFIFAIIGEELGFVGCCVVLILLLLIVVECTMVGMRSSNFAGRMICGGVAALIGAQTMINICVATRLFPNTGLSLPFVSYGLTSIVCFYMGIGFVLNVGLQSNKLNEE